MQWLGIHGPSECGKDTVADIICRHRHGHKIPLADPIKRFCRVVFGFSNVQLWGPSSARNAVDERFLGATHGDTVSFVRSRFRVHAPSWVRAVLPHLTEAQQQYALTALQAVVYSCFDIERLTTRYVLQVIGTEWGRAQDPDIWLLYAERYADPSDERLAIIPDVRFVNEAVFLHKRNAPLLEVVRPNQEGQHALAAGVAEHQSERERVALREVFTRYITGTIHNDSTLAVLEERVLAAVCPESSTPPTGTTPSMSTPDAEIGVRHT